jgi:hypothetical protein
MIGQCDECLADNVPVEPCDLLEGDMVSGSVLLCQRCWDDDDLVVSLEAIERSRDREAARWYDAVWR